MRLVTPGDRIAELQSVLEQHKDACAGYAQVLQTLETAQPDQLVTLRVHKYSDMPPQLLRASPRALGVYGMRVKPVPRVTARIAPGDGSKRVSVTLVEGEPPRFAGGVRADGVPLDPSAPVDRIVAVTEEDGYRTYLVLQGKNNTYIHVSTGGCLTGTAGFRRHCVAFAAAAGAMVTEMLQEMQAKMAAITQEIQRWEQLSTTEVLPGGKTVDRYYTENGKSARRVSCCTVYTASALGNNYFGAPFPVAQVALVRLQLGEVPRVERALDGFQRTLDLSQPTGDIAVAGDAVFIRREQALSAAWIPAGLLDRVLDPAPDASA